MVAVAVVSGAYVVVAVGELVVAVGVGVERGRFVSRVSKEK